MTFIKPFTSFDPCHKVRGCLEKSLGFLKVLVDRIHELLFSSFFPKYSILFKSNQGLCLGAVNLNHVVQLLNILNYRRKPGVFFNSAAIEPVIHKGTCSAMSFDFIDQYLKYRAENVPLSASRIIENLNGRYRQSSPYFRDCQAAFDTIARYSFEKTLDFKKDKIASMIALFNRRVGHYSEDIALNSLQSYEKIAQSIDRLPKGIFAIRSLHRDNSIKEEEHGHTTAFINEDDGQFYYDPNWGFAQIKRGYAARSIHEFLQNANRTFNIPEARFYQVL